MWAKWIYQKLYKNGRRILRYGIRRSTPFVDWVPELRDTSVLRADFVSGVTVALVLVPQSMAYAQLAGLPTYYGLYASFLPVIVASLFGSSRQLATGPVAVISLLTASALEPIAASGSDGYIAYAIMLALMVGVFQLILGMLKMGMLVDFLSHPVVIGFTNAAALIIATSQLSKLLGVDAVRGDAHYETVWNVLVAAYHHLHLPTVAMSIIAIGLMLLLPKIWRRLPPILVAAVLTTVGSWAIGFEANFGGRIVGSIPQGLPAFSMPELDVAVMLDLLGVAVAISLIGFMEAYSIAKAVSMRKTRQELDPNQELVGQGLSNIVASLFQGYAVSGSFSRTAVNMEAGGRTGFSSVVTGLVVGATLLFLTPMLYYMPQAMLASVIIMAVIPLVRVKPILYAWKVQKHDAVVSVLTFVLTLVWGTASGAGHHRRRAVFAGGCSFIAPCTRTCIGCPEITVGILRMPEDSCWRPAARWRLCASKGRCFSPTSVISSSASCASRYKRRGCAISSLMRLASMRLTRPVSTPYIVCRSNWLTRMWRFWWRVRIPMSWIFSNAPGSRVMIGLISSPPRASKHWNSPLRASVCARMKSLVDAPNRNVRCLISICAK